MTDQTTSIDGARRDYKFRLDEATSDRCFDCRHHQEQLPVRSTRVPDCILLDIYVADAKNSRCPLHEPKYLTIPRFLRVHND